MLFHNAEEFSLLVLGINDNYELYIFVVERHVCHKWLIWFIDYDDTNSILTQTV